MRFHGRGPWRALFQNLALQSRRAGMEPAVCGMFGDPGPSRSGGRGLPGPYARSICAMSRALERGMQPGVAGYLSTRRTYDQLYFFKSALDLALVTFAVEKMISFLAKVHGQSVLRHGQA